MKISDLRKIAENMTPGKRLVREDNDYYQGGFYVGVDPYYYLNGGNVDGVAPKGKAQYFKRDLYRVAGNEADELFVRVFDPDLINKLLDVVEAAGTYNRGQIEMTLAALGES